MRASERSERATNDGLRGRGTHDGPLRGVRVIELAGLGPAPFAGMVLADLGRHRDPRRPTADGEARPASRRRRGDVMGRGKQSVAIDLKQPAASRSCSTCAPTVDVLIEGFRPGVTERLGVGPDAVPATATRRWSTAG